MMTIAPILQVRKLRHREGPGLPNSKREAGWERTQWQPGSRAKPEVLPALAPRTAVRPPPQLADRDPHLVRHAAQAADGLPSWAGREKAQAAAGSWRGFPHLQGTDGKAHLTGKERPVPWSWQGARCLPGLVPVEVHCLAFNSLLHQLLELLLTVYSQNNTRHCFFQPRSAEACYLPIGTGGHQALVIPGSPPGRNVTQEGGFQGIWREPRTFRAS